jgi:signal transduction histidine kinase
MACWIVFATVNVWLMWALPGSETIPFHFVWISIALVFGLNTWPLRTMIVMLVVVTVTTGTVMVHHAVIGATNVEETAEIPLMAAVFLVMVWHVRRRQAAVAGLARVAELELQRAKSQQVFVRMVTHELRTPITVARGYVELMRKENADQAIDEDCAIVLAELSKLDTLSARVATLTQLDGPQPVEEIDLDAFLERLVHRWSPVAVRNWLVCSDIGTVQANEERLQAALDSLIDNAVKFTDEHDTIEVRGRREADQVVITVRDTGGGIASEDLPHVFDQFWSGTRDGVRSGTGLGLAITKAAVQARGGTVTVNSTPENGTTFTVAVPLQAPWHERVLNREPTDASSTRSAKRHSTPEKSLSS